MRRGRHAGGAVLLDKYPRRFVVFFYCNTASFMAPIALILLLVNPNLSRLAIRCYALYACQVAGLFGLMGAYAAGSARRLRTSIFALVLVAMVIAFVTVNIIMFSLFKPRTAVAEVDAPAPAEEEEEEPTPRDDEETEYRDEAGLAPPGGLWQDDGTGGVGHGREAGNPVLHDTDQRRFHVFFYSNSTSFVASVVVIALLLQQILRRHRPENHELLLLATNTAVVLDLLGLLAAYAAGSTREWRNGYEYYPVSRALLAELFFILVRVHMGVFGIEEVSAEDASVWYNTNFAMPFVPPVIHKKASAKDVIAELKKIPNLAPMDWLKACNMLRYDNFQFRSLKALPMDMRKEWLLNEIK
ncbi:uncharacterized protein C2845_PM13G10720 [Panicum miliaceum]|uniref:PGG domain-containing protein n=1 Tax=Panicum miliaceum TaxID=4540 RepID=A0A3L6RL19_PANMI|nr:uncharacterized protein C2845_PM13G10720 [Panicum miliaceum]